MAEAVINGMVNLKLTAEEEEEIQVSEEGRSEEMDSCALSLIRKFLTCKPYNRKAAKNTLRRAWGLDKELQISEVAPIFSNSSSNLNMNSIASSEGGRGVLIINF